MMDNMNDFENEINELWNSNSKIPFMQSKEILELGYKTGYNKGYNKKPNKEEKCFVGTNKELINNVKNNKSSKSNNNDNIFKKEKYELLIKLTSDILKYMESKDFLDVYDYVKKLNKEYQDKLFYIKTNVGFND